MAKTNEKMFGIGEIAVLTEKDGRTNAVKILHCFKDDDGWWYEVYPTEFAPAITREVPQAMLSKI